MKACNLKLPIDRRKGRTSKRKKSPSSLLRGGPAPNPGTLERKADFRSTKPEDLPNGRRHVALFKRWAATPNRVTFAEFIQSAYC